MLLDFLRDQVLAQVLAYIIPIAVTAIIGWLAILYAKVTGKNLDAKNREALQSALENGVRFAINELLKGKLTPQGTVPEGDKAAVLATAKNYVATSVPGALKHFKVTNSTLDTLLTAKLPIQGEIKKATVSK